jgi:hypothetical protein|tara:strand:- start:15 stop:233 length:219 start_codon:yes stop_codon:yes gene_type:complete
MALKMSFGVPDVGSLWVNAYSGICIVVEIKPDGDFNIIRYRHMDNHWRPSEMFDYNFFMYFKPLEKKVKKNT